MNNIVPLKMLDNDAVEIGSLYRKGCASLIDSANAYVEAGRRLIKKKQELSHGAWLPWLAANSDTLGFTTPRTAQLLMDAARKANTKLASHMGLDTVTAIKISRDIWGHDEPAQTRTTGNNNSASTSSAKSPRQRMHTLPRGAEIATAFTNKNAPWGIMKVLDAPGCRGIWDMMLQCYDAGFLCNSNYYPNPPHDICSLRLLFPKAQRSFAGKFNLSEKSARDYVRDTVIPVALANRDKVLADQESLAYLVRRSKAPQPEPTPPPPPNPEPLPQSDPESTPSIDAAESDSFERHKQWVDPEFTGTDVEFVDKYGHVQLCTAEQYATLRFGEWAACMKSLAKQFRKLPPLPVRPVDHNWLRSPEVSDIIKLAAALDCLSPVIDEAKALLSTAKAARKTDL